MKVVGYCRIGTKNNEQHSSFEMQQNIIEQISKQNNFELVEIYTDLGISGTTTIKVRKEMQRLLKDSESDKYDAVLIKSIDKLSRNTKDLMDIFKVLEKNNKKVYFISKNMEVQELSNLMNIVLDSVAQLESENISERIKKGIRD